MLKNTKKHQLLGTLLLSLLFLVGCGCGSTPTTDTENEGSTTSTTEFFTPEPPPIFNQTGLRLAALNTEFMFDGIDDEGQATFPHKGNPELARAHRDKIAKLIRMMNPDVLVMEEIENGEVLEMIIEESLSDLGYSAYFVQGRDRFTGQNVGIISKIPIDTVGRTDAREKVGFSDRLYGVSKNIFARLTFGNQPVTIIGLHFLAQPSNPERKDKRQAQGEVIRQLVAQEMAAGRAVAVLGDFNDFDNATLDRGANQPITNVLETIKSAGPGTEDDLRNMEADVPQEMRFTSHWDRNRNDHVDPTELSAIDHILLSPALYRKVKAVRFIHAHDPLEYTDHFPIMVILDY